MLGALDRAAGGALRDQLPAAIRADSGLDSARRTEGRTRPRPACFQEVRYPSPGSGVTTVIDSNPIGLVKHFTSVREEAQMTSVENDADVIVVGAGPGGSAAAYHLARHGVRVLLLEKTEFPREKVCGDGLTPRAVRQLIRMGVDTSPEAGWLHNKGLRVIGGGVRLELDWPDLASFPNYGLVRTRLDFDDLLAQRAVEAGAELRTGVNVTGPVLDARRPGRRGRRRGRPGQGARARSAPRWSSRPTASPAGSRSRWAWPSARTGRSAWPSGATTARRPSTTTTTWSPGWSCAAQDSDAAAARLRLDLRARRRPGQRRPRRAQLAPSAFGKTNYRRHAHRLAGQHARRTGG